MDRPAGQVCSMMDNNVDTHTHTHTHREREREREEKRLWLRASSSGVLAIARFMAWVGCLGRPACGVCGRGGFCLAESVTRTVAQAGTKGKGSLLGHEMRSESGFTATRNDLEDGIDLSQLTLSSTTIPEGPGGIQRVGPAGAISPSAISVC